MNSKERIFRTLEFKNPDRIPLEKVARDFAGKITFWGEVSRQTILPKGSPGDVRNAVRLMKEKLWVQGGGLIGQSEINKDTPFENIEALLQAWTEH
jgi:uroporphyrinogen decarboxylase